MCAGQLIQTHGLQIDQLAGNPDSLHEGKIDNVSLSTNVTDSVETGKGPTLSMEVLPSVSPVQGDTSNKVGSGYSGSTMNYISFLT